ncbi:MAG: tetratricopeptide repeat protein [Candidatus Eremiobacterota bacterium]
MTPVDKTFEYYKQLWEEYFKEKKIIEAMEIISKAGSLYPERYETVYALIDCCREGLTLDPGNMELYHLLAMCFLRLGKWDSAAIVAKEALKTNRKDVRFYNLMAYVSIMDFEPEMSVTIYKKLMELVPEEEYNVSFNIGFSCLSCGKIEEAEKIWKALLVKYPDDKRILYSLDLLQK